MEPRLLTPVEVADILHVSLATAYKLMSRGNIPSIKIGALVRVQHDELMKYLDGIQKQADAARLEQS